MVVTTFAMRSRPLPCARPSRTAAVTPSTPSSALRPRSGRWGDPEDMVGPCVFLASHASDFVNGQILYADGGILAYIGRQPK